MKNQDNKPLISIIIPAYNAAKCLSYSLGSALKQQFDLLEIVVVDDASTDDTRAVAQKLAHDDKRVKIQSHTSNQGPAMARNTGIEQAHGDYLLFLDADDALAPDTCVILAEELAKSSADILHFAMYLEVQDSLSKPAAEHMQRYFTPPNQSLAQWEIIESAFLYYEHNWNLAGKLIRTSLCRQALEMMPQTSVLLGEDLLFYFFVALNTRLYRGVPQRRLYLYRYGAGGSNREKVSLDQFEKRWLTTIQVPEHIAQEMQNREAPASYKRVLASIRNHLLGETMDAIASLLQPKDKPLATMKVLQAWRASEVVSYLCRAYWNNPCGARELFSFDSDGGFKHNGYEREIYYSVNYDHNQAMRCLSGSSNESGTPVATFLTEESMPYDACFDSNIEVASLAPRLPCVSPAAYKERALTIERLVQELQIGKVVFLEYYDTLYFWDAVLWALLGVAVFDAEGNDLIPSLALDEALREAIAKGATGEELVTLANSDFMREHLGWEYATKSYCHQAQALAHVQNASSLTQKVKRRLAKPYKLVRRKRRP